MKEILKNTPENITFLEKNEVIVVGTNFFGFNGAGAAKMAQDKFGLLHKVPMGLQGQSYGIITKDLEGKVSSIDLSNFIFFQLITLYKFAEVRKDLYFYMTKIGTGLGGFTMQDMKKTFEGLKILGINKPENIILPIEFE